MKNKVKVRSITAIGLFILFVIFTVVVKYVDVKAIGPNFSEVGLASINQKVLDLIGGNLICYKLTEVLGILSIIIGLCFGALGLYQLIRGRSFKAVDASLYVLAGFYVLLAVFYVLFEKVVINYRPVLEDNELAASYPSSHTVLIVGILVTTILQLKKRISEKPMRITFCAIIILITIMAVFGRLAAGVHWFTDIVGGLLLVSSLIMGYAAVAEAVEKNG